MATSVDQLQIDITSQATRANDAIDRLVVKLDRLSTSLQRIDGSKIAGLANGVSRLGVAMQSMNNVKTADFTRLANNIQKLGTINVSAINSAASSMSHMTRAFNGLGTVSANAQAVGDLARNISKLGNKGVQTAITNMPQLATSLRSLMATLAGAPKVSNNIIQMTNALANLASRGRGIGTASNAITSGLNRTSRASVVARNRFFSLSYAIGKFYQTYFILSRAIKGLYSAITSSANYIEAFNYYTVAFGKIASEWDEDWEKYGDELAQTFTNSFVTRMNKDFSKLSGVQIELSDDYKSGILTETGMKNLGLNIQQITQYASQLASVTNSVGLTGRASLATASSFTKLAGDISSLFNIDYSSVSTNLQSGLIGQSRALYKYGIDITNATLQTYAYELGLEKAVSEMTQAEKMQLRLIAILDQSKVSWGDLANTINSPSNLIRQLSTNLKECGTVFGQLFIPVVQRVLPAINGLAIAFKRLMINMAGFMNVNLDLSSFGQGYTELEDELDDITSGLENATAAAEEYKNQILGFDEITKLQDPKKSDDSSLGDTIDLTDEILKATEEYEKIWNEAYEKMENKAQKWADRLSKSLKPLENVFKSFSIGDYLQAGQDVSNLVVSINDFWKRAIDNVDWNAVGNNIGNFLKGINWTKTLSSIGELIWEAITSAIDLWKGSFDAAPIETGIVTAIAGLSWLGIIPAITKSLVSVLNPTAIVTSISNLVSTAFSSGGIFGAGGVLATASGPVLAVVAAVSALAVGLGAVFATNEDVRKSFQESIAVIKEGMQPAITFMAETVLPDLQSGWQRILEILSPIGTFLQEMFVSIWQDFLNPALSYIGETVLPRLSEAFENLWNNVLVPLWSFMASVFEPIIQIISDVLSVLWKNVVVPLAGAMREVLGTAFESICDIFNFVITAIQPLITVLQFLWDKVLSPIVSFLWNSFKPVFENVFKIIGEVISGLGTALSGVIKFVTGVFTGDWKKAWNGVVDIFKGIFNGLSSIVEGVFNFIIDGINKFLGKFDGVVNSFGDVIGIDISIPKIPKLDIPAYVNGGMPNTGELFMARENGINEMVGRIGNHSAVANNDQIVQSIQGGVEAAMMNVMMAFAGNMSGNNEAPVIENVVKCDSETMYRMVKKGKEKHDGRYHVVTEF